MRTIKNIVVHCTATPTDATVTAICRYWREQLGWKNPGYHYIILRDGSIDQLLDEELIANGVAGHNADSIHVAYIGGIDKDGKPIDNRSDMQRHTLFDILVWLCEKHQSAHIVGHRDFPGVSKACPCFDVREWLRYYVPPVIENINKIEDEDEPELSPAA
ncbi:MAG: N-acetylmuramoyl-L-alanine amidase [Bacteroidales bacterium]|jgi:N-acetylmuramoyl-L-alanine amidase